VKLLFKLLLINTLFILPSLSLAQTGSENNKIAAGVIESAQENGTARVLIWYNPEIKEPKFNQAASQLDAISSGTNRAIFDS